MITLNEISDEKLIKIKAIITDVDGVMTDGAVTYTTRGEQILKFHAQDGAGIRSWRNVGGKFAFLTGRSSSMVARRALELEIDAARMNAKDKPPHFKELLDELEVTAEEVLYIGDDWPDIPCMLKAGLGIAVNDAVPEVLEVADGVTGRAGGCGAVREVISKLLKVQDKLEGLLDNYK